MQPRYNGCWEAVWHNGVVLNDWLERIKIHNGRCLLGDGDEAMLVQYGDNEDGRVLAASRGQGWAVAMLRLLHSGRGSAPDVWPIQWLNLHAFLGLALKLCHALGLPSSQREDKSSVWCFDRLPRVPWRRARLDRWPAVGTRASGQSPPRRRFAIRFGASRAGRGVPQNARTNLAGAFLVPACSPLAHALRSLAGLGGSAVGPFRGSGRFLHRQDKSWIDENESSRHLVFVMQPRPTSGNRSCTSWMVSGNTREPGASDMFIHDLVHLADHC